MKITEDSFCEECGEFNDHNGDCHNEYCDREVGEMFQGTNEALNNLSIFKPIK